MALRSFIWLNFGLSILVEVQLKISNNVATMYLCNCKLKMVKTDWEKKLSHTATEQCPNLSE